VGRHQNHALEREGVTGRQSGLHVSGVYRVEGSAQDAEPCGRDHSANRSRGAALVARSRGPEWFYTYMRSFYRDEKSSTGWNNTVFPSVAMPHVLYEMQGLQRAVYRTEKHESESVKDGKKVKKVTEEQVFDRFEIEKPGSMTPQQYDESMRDLTNFMVYVGEPAKLVRYRIGITVLVFLAIFLVVAYLLKKEYWKDVH
jgi:ubiquinol-cytochrome c reductase cytochrome c1 subunit